MTVTTIIHTMSTEIFYCDKEDKEELISYLSEYEDLCSQLSVHRSITHDSESCTFKVVVFGQKCTLDSMDTNTLFSEILSVFDYEIEYANLGGVGCNMSISVIEKVG